MLHASHEEDIPHDRDSCATKELCAGSPMPTAASMMEDLDELDAVESHVGRQQDVGRVKSNQEDDMEDEAVCLDMSKYVLSGVPKYEIVPLNFVFAKDFIPSPILPWLATLDL